MNRSRSSYHSIGSRSFMPPCMRICVPSIATSSRIFSPIFVEAQRVAVRVLVVPAEGAERTLGRADVGVVDVPIDDVGAVILGVQVERGRVGPLPQVVQRRVVEKLQRLRVGQAGFALDHGVDVECQISHGI